MNIEHFSQWLIAQGVHPLIGGIAIGLLVAMIIGFTMGSRRKHAAPAHHGSELSAHESNSQHRAAPRARTDVMPEELARQIEPLLRRNNKIEAIKLVRAATGSDLKDAKDLVEAFERSL